MLCRYVHRRILYVHKTLARLPLRASAVKVDSNSRHMLTPTTCPRNVSLYSIKYVVIFLVWNIFKKICFFSYCLHLSDTRRLPQSRSFRSRRASQSFHMQIIACTVGMGYIQKHVAFPTRCSRLIREVCRKVHLCAFPTQ